MSCIPVTSAAALLVNQGSSTRNLEVLARWCVAPALKANIRTTLEVQSARQPLLGRLLQGQGQPALRSVHSLLILPQEVMWHVRLARTVVPWAYHLARSCTPSAALWGNRTCTAAPPAPRSCFRIAATCMTPGCLVRENYRSCKWRANVRLHCIPRTTTSPLQRSSQSHTACSSRRRHHRCS